MTFSIDKDMTTINALQQVKADIKDFRQRFTDNDIYYYLYKATEDLSGTFENITDNGDVLKIDVEAWNRYGDTRLYFDLWAVTRHQSNVIRVQFFADIDMNISLDNMTLRLYEMRY